MEFEKRLTAFQDILLKTVATDHSGNRLQNEDAMVRSFEMLKRLRSDGNRLFIIGNGGSAAIASHAVIDFLNVAGIAAHTLHDSAVMTCMANDYGYEQGFARVLDCFADGGDILIAISSSGKSANILNAVARSKERSAGVITLSGFAESNPLRSLGDLNFWLPSADYGLVEVGHQFLLHNISDRFLAERREQT